MIRLNRRKSKIWFLPENEFVELVKNSTTYTQVLNYFGLTNKGNNFKTLKTRIKELKISVDHFETQNYASKIKITIPLEQILVKNSTYTNMWRLKQRLFKSNLLIEKCEECNIGNSWNGKSLTLTIDHKNGISDDNRIENLRILCPNCHSQTHNFAGRNKRIL